MERPAGITQDTTCVTAPTAMLSSVQCLIPMGACWAEEDVLAAPIEILAISR